MSFPEAKQFLGGNSPDPLPSKPLGGYAKDFESPKWQRRAEEYSEEAIDRLWSPQGEAALDYLRKRGLSDETIAKARLGYSIISNQDWNKAPCVVFPWFSDGQYWRIQFRTIDPDVPREKRYRMAKGGSNSGLYLADVLRLKRPVFLVEGELDALSLAQKASDLIAVVATGSTAGSRAPKWEARLSCAEHVFVAFDRDEKGNEAAEHWLKILPNSLRWQPIAHDVNDMLRYGIDIPSWVQAALDIAQAETDLSREGYELCSSCHCLIPTFEDWEPEQIPLDAPSLSFDPTDGQMYCKQCRSDLFELLEVTV